MWHSMLRFRARWTSVSNDGSWSPACKPAIADRAICANDTVAPTAGSGSSRLPC